MRIYIYSLIGAGIMLGACTEERTVYIEPVVIQPARPVYPTNQAVILTKRSLPNNREEYTARLNDGRVTVFTVNGPLYYQVGDSIIVP